MAGPPLPPIIAEPAFLARMREVLAALPGPIRPIVQGDPDDLVRLVETEINNFDAHLQLLIGQARYTIGHRMAGFTRLQAAAKPGTYSLIDTALTREKRVKLCGTLAGQIVPFASMYFNALPLPRAIDGPTIANFSVLHANSYAYHGVRTICTFFQNNVDACLQHVVDDWDDIENLFFRDRNGPGDIGEPDLILLKLSEIRVMDSDPHKKGKRVMMLKFLANLDPAAGPAPPPPQGRMAAFVARVGIGSNTQNQNRLNFNRPRTVRLIFKPSDLEIDCRLVGNTAALTAAGVGGLPNLAAGGGSLFEVFNQNIGNTAAPALTLPTYRILPRNAGSLLGPMANPMAFTNAYGYIEFLTHEPEPQNASGGTIKDDRKALPPEKWDWIATSDDELERYYRQLGWIGVIAEIFSMADVHKENMIVHRKQPHLIDLEITFKVRIEKFMTTLMTMIFAEGRPPEQKCHLFYRGTFGNEKWTTGSAAANAIADGMAEAANAIIQPGAIAAINTWLGDAHLANTFVRFTAAETGFYWQGFIAVFYQAPLAVAPDPNNPADVNWGLNQFPINYTTGLREWCDAETGMGFIAHQPNFALRSVEHDWKCFMFCDLPAYYRRLGSIELLNARGEYCVIPQPANRPANPGPPAPAVPARRIAGPHYFDYYPACHLFTISPPLTNADVTNITGGLRNAFNTGGHALPGPPTVVTGVQESTNRWRVTSGANTYHILQEVNAATTQPEWRVYSPGTAIQMAQRQFQRFHTDAQFRQALVSEAQATIRTVCVRPVGMSGYNGF